MNHSISISLQTVPLSQDLEHRDRICQPHLEVTPDAMHDFLEMADQSQHREHGFDDHPYRPGLGPAYFQVRGVNFFGMKACIRQHSRFCFKATDERLKVNVRDISCATVPSHHQPILVQEQAEFADHDPASVRQPFASILLRATTLPDRVNQLDAVGVNHPHDRWSDQESFSQMPVRLELAKQARSLRQVGEQMTSIPHEPAIKGTIADTFQSKLEGQGDDLARVESGLRVLRHVRQFFINAKEQFYGKFFGGHGLQSPCCIGLVAIH